MSQTYSFVPDLNTEVEIPVDSILSSTLHEDDSAKVVLFRFSQGQALSEHTASKPATLQILAGEARIQLGDDTIEAKPGSWIHMPPELPHAVEATTALTLLLYLIKT